MNEANVVLLGFTGAGKSTVGALVARRLGWPCVDIDARVEARHGPIVELVARRGAATFRRFEREVVAGLPRAGTVVATGAGTVLHRGCRHRLCAGARVFFLDAPAEVLAARLMALPRAALHRPDLVPVGEARAAVVARLAHELARRRPLYAGLGRPIDATLAPDAVAELVVTALAPPMS